MKFQTAAFAAGSLALFVSCQSLQPMPDADLDAKARSAVGDLVAPEPLKLVVDSDFVDQRITVVQQMITTKGAGNSYITQPLADMPEGLSFGNGLYIDNNGNFSLRLDRLAGVDDNYVGKLVRASVTEKETKTTTITYGADAIQLEGTKPISRSAKKVSALNNDVTFKDNGDVEVSTWVPFSGTTWKKAKDGYRFESFKSFLGIIPYIAGVDYRLKDGKVTNSENTFEVEDKGNSVRFAFTKGNKWAFRLYRSSDKIALIQEWDGKGWLFFWDGTTLGWDSDEVGFFGMNTGKTVHQSLTLDRS